VDRVAAPRWAENFCAVTFRNFIRAVRDLVVNGQDDFAGPALHAVERGADAVRLVAGDEADGDGQLVMKLVPGHFSKAMRISNGLRDNEVPTAKACRLFQ